MLWSFAWLLLRINFAICLLLILLTLLIVGSLLACHRVIQSFWQPKQTISDASPTDSRDANATQRKLVIGFFHPYCNAGGGGERVLWQMIATLLQQPSASADTKATAATKLKTSASDADATSSALPLHILIYTGDDKSITDTQILHKASTSFHLPALESPLIAQRITFIRIANRELLDAALYPRFTMLMQSLASMLVCYTSLCLAKPHIFFDTTGFAFTYPVAKHLFGCHQVMTYTHYPTISTDMLSLVAERRSAYNNSAQTSQSPMQSTVKLLYYRLFAAVYTMMGQQADLVLVNGTWTHEHIAQLWQQPQVTHRVFPPCDTCALCALPLKRICLAADDHHAIDQDNAVFRQNTIVSIGQFRPEKAHALQIESFAQFLASRKQSAHLQPVRLILLGGCRSQEDETRVAALRELAKSLHVEQHVDFVLNAPFSTLQQYLSNATVGLHTMWNEHFGIGCVEYMAAGCIAVAHRSGGPLRDIVQLTSAEQQIAAVQISGGAKLSDKELSVLQSTADAERKGFLCETRDDYAAALSRIFDSSYRGTDKMQEMRVRARQHVSERFSDQVFADRISSTVTPRLRQILDQLKIVDTSQDNASSISPQAKKAQ